MRCGPRLTLTIAFMLLGASATAQAQSAFSHGAVSGPVTAVPERYACFADSTGRRIKECGWTSAGPSFTKSVELLPTAKVDGTDCTKTDRAVNGVNMATIACAAAGSIDMTMNMPDSWDGQAVTFELVGEDEAASPSGTSTVGFACQCDTIDTTFGTSQNASITYSAQYTPVFVTTANVTPANTCSGGDLLVCRGTPSASASGTDYFISIKMEYGVNAVSD